MNIKEIVIAGFDHHVEVEGKGEKRLSTTLCFCMENVLVDTCNGLNSVPPKFMSA